ncbi:hypothetical protein BCIN_13g05330 [Botrytis cinerea B05.10]|uniref:Uncharacterized protein n=1 Tax=Botryotinia fuckeliana (strain B05.10) TaxID=332648 RepID=A0A384K1M7_BOTFB|nr:hypothetical protein BCIN_13g05330 [Botrytis cinerea B05.10]ATZ56698.1 hypothetical protein BCIN_13g05330 [Botrytis cinerea B05.10]
MGIPYSKQIHSAFDQSQIMMRRLQTEVTPLVAAGYPLVASGFEVLKTTKNIAILLAVVQVYTALMLTVIFGVGCMLLVTTNPDLEDERRRMISPTVRAGVEWIEKWGGWVEWSVKFGIVCGVAGMGVGVWKGERAGEMESKMVVEGENETGSEDKEEDGSDEKNEVDDMDDVGK